MAGHVAKEHAAANQVPFLCLSCLERYTRRSDLVKHVSKCHPDEIVDKLIGGTGQAYPLTTRDARPMTGKEFAAFQQRQGPPKGKRKRDDARELALHPTDRDIAIVVEASESPRNRRSSPGRCQTPDSMPSTPGRSSNQQQQPRISSPPDPQL